MDELIEAYRSGRLVLFVGAGVSMNLGLPSWRELIDHMAQDLGFDAEIYQTYGSAQALAEYYRIKKGSLGSLRSWMDREWHDRGIDVARSRVHELIARGRFDLIYTTNYDRWIEQALEHYAQPFSKIANVGDLVTADLSARQVVKFHGDFDDDSSIVLDDSSYFRRFDFESPLDIKLRSDVLGRSVLFIGYGFDDPNIRFLFFKLAELWRNGGAGAAQPRSFLYAPRPNPVQESVLGQWNISMVTPTSDDVAAGLITLLEQVTGLAAPASPTSGAVVSAVPARSWRNRRATK